MTSSFEGSVEGLVSIVVAFYNAERFLAEAIESVLAQTYTQWELLLVDDGSTDSGTKIAHEYAARSQGRIRCLEHPGHRNLGMCTARNLAVRESRGQFIAVLDSDDYWLPHKLEEQVALIKTYPEVGLIYGHSEYWYDWSGEERHVGKNFVDRLAPSGRVYYPPELFMLCNLGHVGQPCPSDFFLRREVVMQVSGFEEVFDPVHQMYEDQAFLAKIYLKVPVYVAPACWDRYRIHEKSLGAVSDSEGRSEATKQFYFRWLGEYLRESGVKEEQVWKAYRRLTRYYRHPWIGALAKAVRPTVKAARAIFRRQTHS